MPYKYQGLGAGPTTKLHRIIMWTALAIVLVCYLVVICMVTHAVGAS